MSGRTDKKGTKMAIHPFVIQSRHGGSWGIFIMKNSDFPSLALPSSLLAGIIGQGNLYGQIGKRT
jgi:hypothetical protein